MAIGITVSGMMPAKPDSGTSNADVDFFTARLLPSGSSRFHLAVASVNAQTSSRNREKL